MSPSRIHADHIAADRSGDVPDLEGSICRGRNDAERKLILYSDAGHGFLYQRPDEVAGEILDLLRATSLVAEFRKSIDKLGELLSRKAGICRVDRA